MSEVDGNDHTNRNKRDLLKGKGEENEKRGMGGEQKKEM